MAKRTTKVATNPKRRKRWLWITLATLLMLFGCVFWYIKRAVLALDLDHPPQFIQADFIDLSRIVEISKFRSGVGHDFSYDSDETCRSMKHYFSPQSDGNDKDIQKLMQEPDPATAISIFSPVTGQILSISQENTPIGRQFSIRPDSNPGFEIRLFHVFPDSGIHALMKVTAGQKLGVIGAHQGTDIAIDVNTLHGTRYLSYFSVMPDKLFANYQARGVKSRDDLIISRAYRDAHPLQCNGEMFVEIYDSDPNSGNDVYLSGYQPIQYGEKSPDMKGSQPNRTQNQPKQ